MRGQTKISNGAGLLSASASLESLRKSRAALFLFPSFRIDLLSLIFRLSLRSHQRCQDALIVESLSERGYIHITWTRNYAYNHFLATSNQSFQATDGCDVDRL